MIDGKSSMILGSWGMDEERRGISCTHAVWKGERSFDDESKRLFKKIARTFSISRQSISTRLAVEMTTRSRPVLYQIWGRRI